MADVASAAAGRLIELLEEQTVYHINLVRGAEDEVHSLADKLITIRSVLDDAENRRFKNDSISIWLSKLERTFWAMEDVLDQWDYAILKHRFGVAPPKQEWSLIPSCSCICFKNLVIRHEIATKILKVKLQLDEIWEEQKKFGLVISQPTDQPTDQQALPKPWRDSTSFAIQDHGRDSDVDTLLKKLTGDGGGMRVVSIVGVGGLGKTIIAQAVYNDSRLENHFDLKIWVCVSDPFDLAAIAKAIIKSVTKKLDSPSTDTLETLWQHVRGFISGKKYLMVLDDVWTEEYSNWERLENYLRCGGEGSKILVTTRKTKVAKILGTMDGDIHNPEMLSDEDCWMLMRRIAHPGNDDQLEKFEFIGKEIAKKCNGLPLAAKTLGSLLRCKSKLQEWEIVLNSDVWDLKEAELELFPHLLLSYNELSTTLKHCFSYCAVFPKDSKIYVGELIRNWMAHGYLGNDINDVEDRGQRYFDILEMHSLFQEIHEDETGEMHCQMHNIVHDFAQFLRKRSRGDARSKNKCTTCQDCGPSTISTVNEFRSLFWDDKGSPPDLCECLTSLRVLSLSWCNLQRIPQIMETFIHLRLLNLEGNELSPSDLQIIFKLYNLKTLSLSWSSLKAIPTEIGNLIHLRHLNLSYNESLKELPREIENLIRLRHLDLSSNESLKELPREIGNLIHLRHLNLCRNVSLKELPREIENLIHLRHLNLCRNVSLKELPREIGNLIHLRHLNLSWNRSLKELPREIGNLIHLRHLDLSSNESLKELPREIGNLIHLRHLNLRFNGSLKELPREIENLIHLTYLDLSYNRSLDELPETMCGLQELRILNVESCTQLCLVPDILADLLISLSPLMKFKGGSAWSKLRLLKNLNRLGESVRLVIRLGGDNDLVSVVEDAREAELKNKIHIKYIDITFEDEIDEKVDSSCGVRIREDVMEALEPHPNLQKLLISNYKGSKLPGWMGSPLNQLREVHLMKCHRLTALSSLGKLPCLNWIRIDEMEELEIVGRDFLGFHECSSSTGVVSFPNLTTLTFYSCGKWKEWEDITAEEEASTAMSVMPRLERLRIAYCDGLTALPHRLIRKLASSSLGELNIGGSMQLIQRYGKKDASDWKSISQNNPRIKLRTYWG